MEYSNSSEGLNKVIGCENPKRTADVIFIHGLDGNAYSTWQSEGKPANFWPLWLGEELPNIGVWSLGYAVSSSAWKGSTMPLTDRATNALDQLELDGIGNYPIIFICHSLGGLLVKQMLRHANDFGNADYKRIADQTRGIIFLSTPHSGSNIANWIKHLGIILRSTVSIEELEAHHPRLRELNIWFRNHPNTPQTKILVYCEKIPLAGLLVVDESSADPGISGVVPIPMDDDHVTICKPKNKNAQVYRRVKKLIEQVTTPSSELAPNTAKIPEDISEKPDNEFLEIIKRNICDELKDAPGIAIFRNEIRQQLKDIIDSNDLSIGDSTSSLIDGLLSLDTHKAIDKVLYNASMQCLDKRGKRFADAKSHSDAI